MRRFILLLGLLPALAFAQTSVQVIPSDTITSGCVLNSASGAGSYCVASMRGKVGAGYLVTAISSPLLTIVVQTSNDGTNWTTRKMIDTDTGDRTGSYVGAAIVVGLSKAISMSSGARFARVFVSAYTSGTATVAVTATDVTATDMDEVVGNSDKPTYVACSPSEANTASSSAIECESGASKAHRVRALWVPQVGLQTSSGNRLLTLRRVSTAGSGGTSLTLAPVDSNDAAFTGLCRTKGTAGTTGTTILTRHMWVPTSVANMANPLPIWPPFTIGSATGTTIKDLLIPAGTANGWEVNDAGASGGATFYICVAVTEE